VADTLEDTPHLSPSEKSKRLLRLRGILLDAAKGKRINIEAVSSIYESLGPSKSDDHKLLSESIRLFEILDTLSDSHKKIIYKWVAEMADGMAGYSKLGGKGKAPVITLKDIEDWDRYCYYVAGTVGHMLTELFVLHYDFKKEITAGLKKLGNSFGLGLQKVNVIKDVPDDRERGVCYLPGNILSRYGLNGASLKHYTKGLQIIPFVNEIVGLTIPHLDDAVEYTTYISRHLKGVRMFLIVPVYLAMETLVLIKSNPVQAMTGPPVKLTRKDVARLAAAAGSRIGSDRKLMDYYLELRNKL
jgi:farnesyl-diphosphate farnesyltransferase